MRTLRRVSGIDSWAVGRVIDDTTLVLTALDDIYGVSNGDQFTWSTSLAKRMIEGDRRERLAQRRFEKDAAGQENAGDNGPDTRPADD